jgi:antitoxin component YwqK of YwqJK toxin-antitoxin module
MRLIAIIILFSPITICHAQKGNPRSGTREVILNSGDSIILAHLLLKENKITPNIKKTYFWYLRGKINHNTGNYSGKLMQGNFNVFLDDKMVISGKFDKGLKTGKWITWFNDGTIDNIILYKNGVKIGKHKKEINKYKHKTTKVENQKKIKGDHKLFRNKKIVLPASNSVNLDD